MLLLAAILEPTMAVSRKYLSSRAQSENWETGQALARGGIERKDVTVDYRELHRMSE